MEHDMNMGTMDPNGGSTMPPMDMGGTHMWMWFHTKVADTVLIKTWNVEDAGTMVGTCIIIIIAAIFLEGVKYTRWLIQNKQKEQEFIEKSYLRRLFSPIHLLQTVLFLLQLGIGYILMLLFMTFSMMMKMMMEMYFHFRIEEPILFREWKPLNTTAYVFSCIGIFLIALFLEFLKFGRTKLISKEVKTREETINCCCSNNDGTWDIPESTPLRHKPQIPLRPFTAASLSSTKHVLSSILFFVQNFVDYSLMLVAMTYNYPIFLSLLAGHTVGYFFVGPLMTVEDSEKVGNCCS